MKRKPSIPKIMMESPVAPDPVDKPYWHLVEWMRDVSVVGSPHLKFVEDLLIAGKLSQQTKLPSKPDAKDWSSPRVTRSYSSSQTAWSSPQMSISSSSAQKRKSTDQFVRLLSDCNFRIGSLSLDGKQLELRWRCLPPKKFGSELNLKMVCRPIVGSKQSKNPGRLTHTYFDFSDAIMAVVNLVLTGKPENFTRCDNPSCRRWGYRSKASKPGYRYCLGSDKCKLERRKQDPAVTEATRERQRKYRAETKAYAARFKTKSKKKAKRRS